MTDQNCRLILPTVLFIYFFISHFLYGLPTFWRVTAVYGWTKDNCYVMRFTYCTEIAIFWSAVHVTVDHVWSVLRRLRVGFFFPPAAADRLRCTFLANCVMLAGNLTGWGGIRIWSGLVRSGSRVALPLEDSLLWWRLRERDDRLSSESPTHRRELRPCCTAITVLSDYYTGVPPPKKKLTNFCYAL